MQTISGLFETYAQARAAVRALEAAGIKTADISLIANSPDDITPDESPVGKDAAAGAEVGAILGGAGGLLAGIGVLAIPGLGPVLAGGWLVAAVMGAAAGAGLGAATGGLIGLLTDAGIPKSDAHVYAEGVRRGGALVTVRASDAQADAARDILDRHGAAAPKGLREKYEAEGWAGGGDGPDPAEVDAEEERDRDRYPLVPPVI
ncbi:MAG TPA: hypothetical protein GYA10_06475 [Alphaproteobacteria bacterium]|nr:hypothetical protein [Alphaproteobacteria bacterium]